MKRRTTLTAGAAAVATGFSKARAANAPMGKDAKASIGTYVHAAKGQKVLRYAFRVAETSFDPAAINDVYSRIITAHIFEGLYTWDHLARPVAIVPLTADGMPVAEDDFKTWTFKVKPGIFFADDPAFKGQKRELVAQDYLYSLRRFADPAVKSPVWASLEQLKIPGLNEFRKVGVEAKKPFDYDAPIEGLRLLDRYTLQIRLGEPRPRFLDNMASSDLFGAVAREVVQAYGSDIGGHPVGTGPFKLAFWRRSSLMVFERNPSYRERLWQANPAPDDEQGQAIAAKLRGKRLPLIDRVEVAVIEEQQPRWLSFDTGEYNFIERVPEEFIGRAMPGGKVAPYLRKRGVQGQIVPVADVTFTYFNMDDPVVGGNAPAQVALRRAISLAIDVQREIRQVRYGMAVPAQGPFMPHTNAYNPKLKSEMSEHNPAKARALLDMYGYADRNNDGWRERPNGEPLVLEVATESDQQRRRLAELFQKDLAAVGIATKFKVGQWPENLKSSRAGKLQMWGLASSAAGPDGQGFLQRYFGPQSGMGNLARFKHPQMDALYERAITMADGPERSALLEQAAKLTVAYMPYKLHVHRMVADMYEGNIVGYRRPPVWNEWWHMIDIELPKA